MSINNMKTDSHILSIVTFLVYKNVFVDLVNAALRCFALNAMSPRFESD